MNIFIIQNVLDACDSTVEKRLIQTYEISPTVFTPKMKIIKEYNYELLKYNIKNIVYSDHIDIFKYLYENGLPLFITGYIFSLAGTRCRRYIAQNRMCRFSFDDDDDMTVSRSARREYKMDKLFGKRKR